MNTIIYYMLRILLNGAYAFLELLPYVIGGIMVGEALRYIRWTEVMVKAVNSSPRGAILYAALLGILSPLCTYGTVPVVLQLYRSGMTIIPLTVFLMASSMMNPQLFILTLGNIGFEFALVRVASIVVLSVIVGVIFSFIPESWLINKKVLKKGSGEEQKEYSLNSFSWGKYIRSIFKSFEFIGFYLIIGVMLGAAVEVLMPAKAANLLFNIGTVQAILLVSIISIPTYVCGGGMIPFIHSLMESGMSRGAAIAFFNVGSATRIPIIIALATILSPLCLVLLYLILMIFSVAVGLIY